MLDNEAISKRLDQLIDAGKEVLDSSYWPRGGMILSALSDQQQLVNAEKFHQWRMSTQVLLQTGFLPNNLYLREFTQGCNVPTMEDAIKGLATLRAAKSDIEAEIHLPEESTKVDIEQLPLHPRIASVSVKLFRDGHFADAVYAASKALNNLVQERSGQRDLDGASLMRTVFSRNSPVLAFNDLNDRSDEDEQEGMMHLFEGVALGIRNPHAHDFPEDSADRALEYISLIGLLANRVEESRNGGEPG